MFNLRTFQASQILDQMWPIMWTSEMQVTFELLPISEYQTHYLQFHIKRNIVYFRMFSSSTVSFHTVSDCFKYIYLAKNKEPLHFFKMLFFLKSNNVCLIVSLPYTFI